MDERPDVVSGQDTQHDKSHILGNKVGLTPRGVSGVGVFKRRHVVSDGFYVGLEHLHITLEDLHLCIYAVKTLICLSGEPGEAFGQFDELAGE